MSKNTEVTTIEPAAVVPYSVDGAQLEEILSETLTPGEALTPGLLPTIKIPAAGGKNWELPDSSAAAAVTGVIIHRQTPRSFWVDAFGEGGTNKAPDCWSPDGVKGNGLYGDDAVNPGGKCATCPMSAYGSGKGNSQACRQLTRLYVLRDGDVLPTVVVLPPSSYRACQSYAVQMVNEQGFQNVVSRIGLEQDKNPDGIVYSRASFSMVERLGTEAKARLAAYRAAIIPHLQALAATPESEVV